MLKLRMSDAELKLEVEDERERRVIRSTGNRIRRDTTRVEPTVALTLEGSVYHPNLVEFSTYTEVGYQYHDKLDTALEGSESGSEGEENNVLQDYRVILDVLREKPYAVNLLAQRQLNERDDDFFTRSEVDTERYQLSTGYVPGRATDTRDGTPGGPFSFTVSASRLEETIDDITRPSDDREDVLEFQGFRERGLRDHTRLKYQWTDFKFTERELATDEGVRHLASVTDNRVFGADESVLLASSARYENQDRNDVDSSSIDLAESATLVHSDTLESKYLYTFRDRDVGSSSTLRHEGIASLRHQLFDSLTSTLEAEGRWEEDESPGSLLEAGRYGGGFGEQYTKKLPHESRISLDAGLRLLEHDRDAVGGSRTVIDERHILRNDEITLLDEPDVERSSIRVTDGSGRTTRTEGLDYEILPRGRFTQIRRLPGGFIPDGGAVLVDYRAGAQDSDDYTSTEQRYGARLSLVRGLLDLYVRLYQLDYQDNELLFLQEFDDLVIGAETRWRQFRAGIEYEDYDTNLTPYRTWRLFQSYQLYPTRRSVLVLDLRQQSTDFLEEDDEERLYSFIGRYRHRLTTSLAFYGEAGATLEDGIGSSDAHRDLYRVRSYLEHWIGRLTTRLEYEYLDKDFPADSTDSHRVQLSMVRKF